MKKIIIPFTILTVLLIIGVLSFKFYTGREATISITSVDGKTTLVIGRYRCISYNKSMAVSRFGGQEIIVKDIEDFMDKTVNKSGAPLVASYEDEYRKVYLRAYGGHCFKVEVSNDRIYLSESICDVVDPIWEEYYWYVSPLKEDDGFSFNNKTTATWEETKGFSSIKEVADFYQIIDSKCCEVDKENNLVRVKLKRKYEDLNAKDVYFIIKATDEGIEMYREE